MEPLVAKAKKVHSYQPYDPNVTLYIGPNKPKTKLLNSLVVLGLFS